MSARPITSDMPVKAAAAIYASTLCEGDVAAARITHAEALATCARIEDAIARATENVMKWQAEASKFAGLDTAIADTLADRFIEDDPGDGDDNIVHLAPPADLVVRSGTRDSIRHQLAAAQSALAALQRKREAAQAEVERALTALRHSAGMVLRCEAEAVAEELAVLESAAASKRAVLLAFTGLSTSLPPVIAQSLKPPPPVRALLDAPPANTKFEINTPLDRLRRTAAAAWRARFDDLVSGAGT